MSPNQTRAKYPKMRVTMRPRHTTSSRAKPGLDCEIVLTTHVKNPFQTRAVTLCASEGPHGWLVRTLIDYRDPSKLLRRSVYHHKTYEILLHHPAAYVRFMAWGIHTAREPLSLLIEQISDPCTLLYFPTTSNFRVPLSA